jgi:hypothetical protein
MKKTVDIFPAIVFLAPADSLENLSDLTFTGVKPQGTRKVDRSRVAIVDNKIYIVVDSPEGPRVVFREAVLEYQKSDDKISHRAITASNKMLVFSKDQNCGCGSKLRTWNPFNNQLSATGDPSE